MSAGCVRWMLSHAVRTVSGGSPVYRAPVLRFTICSERYDIAASWRWAAFSTEVDSTEQTAAPKKKKKDSRSASVTSVGRKIPHRHIQVISAAGENLGLMHRADVIKVMDEEGLKLVLLNENKDPPVYQLMGGKQIHEKQVKMWEKKKEKAAPLQVKELSFSAGIAPHDVATKLKHVENWLEKKHHVRITLRAPRGKPADNLGATLEQLVEQMEIMVGFVSRPKVIRDGQAAMCILRLPSAEELSQRAKNKAAVPQPSKAIQSETAPVGSTDTTEGSIQH